jgi:oligopeptide/dipeptide ABC transporter ATP-binding protein
MAPPPLLAVDDLHVRFHTDDGVVRAVNGLSFEVAAGEALGVVGESGCGKSATALALLRLVDVPPGEYAGGAIRWKGRDLLPLPERAVRALRGREIGMVFQEPVGSLNPVVTVGAQVAETVREATGCGRKQAWARAVELMTRAGVPDAAQRARDHAHQLSGGLCQRVMIAAALAGEPDLLVADEPTTALDVTTQARILGLLDDLRREQGMALLLISHDLGVVAEVVDRVLVMYAGSAVEVAPTAELFGSPQHPYTRALLACRPRLDGVRGQPLAQIPGMVADLPPAGCPFRPRCPSAVDRCAVEEPPLRELTPGHRVACHVAGEGAG